MGRSSEARRPERTQIRHQYRPGVDVVDTIARAVREAEEIDDAN